MVLSTPKDLTRDILMCISANKILNDIMLPCSTKLVKKKNQSTESTEICERNQSW